MPNRLGIVVNGSLSKGLDIKLDPDVPIESVKVGQYVVVEPATPTGQSLGRFFCVVSDLRLDATDPALASSPPDLSNPIVAQVIHGTATYGVAHVVPYLMQTSEGLRPVRTIPAHYANASEATQEQVEAVFGADDADHLWIGSPLDMESTLICLDLPRLVERSVGVFGKSGTGKTFLTRILMAGILQKRAAVQLIFDMHNEYGWAGTSEGQSGGAVKGLKQLFGSQVAVFTLDEASSRNRGVSTDGVIEIGYDEIEPGDIETMAETLNLTDIQTQAVWTLADHWKGKSWLTSFLDLDSDGRNKLANELGPHEGTVRALATKLRTLTRLEFVVSQAHQSAVRTIIDYLERGKTVVLEFGRYKDNTIAQVLVANLLSRRIYDEWSRRMEQALGDRSKEPSQLVITIEEAHKFLSPSIASQTIFGTIAREMRKYNVTLLVVDQRPSAIDNEVLSQIGTKLACLLDDEKDVNSVLQGASGAGELRSVLQRLESKQQALIFGHAVPMPVVIRVRDYGTETSYAEFGFRDAAALQRTAERDASLLFGPPG
ncbi:MAG: ATP-binding protein [Dehalococcoidia bacterium]|nr:ATP-binding protein [Dehalococcoidia bacterium]